MNQWYRLVLGALVVWRVQRFLIRAYQYVIARYDVDGFRIDTLRYLKGDLPRLFGNSMREFALSIGKKNFFTFGEVFDPQAEDDIARFIGRNTNDGSDLVGVDAAVDYPLFNALKPVVKGSEAPAVRGRDSRVSIKRGELGAPNSLQQSLSAGGSGSSSRDRPSDRSRGRRHDWA